MHSAHLQPDFSGTELPELIIGELRSLPAGYGDRDAQVAYDRSRPVVLAHDAASEAEASLMLEALTLQLLIRDVDDGVCLALHETRPSAHFSHLKRLLARTGQHYGKPIVGAAAFHDHLHQLTALAHKRYALLANLGVTTIIEYNAHPKVKRPEAQQYLVVSAVLPDSAHEGDLQTLQTLCERGPAVGILPLLLRGPAEDIKDEFERRRKLLLGFWQAVAPIGFGFDWRRAQSLTQPLPVNQFDVYWRPLRRFGVQVGVAPARLQAWVDTLCDAQAHGLSSRSRPPFMRVNIGDEGNEPVFFELGGDSSNHHAIVGGATDMGKSSLMHNVLLSTCETLTPEEFQLWVIDPSGLEFAHYKLLPHLRFLHLGDLAGPRVTAAVDAFRDHWTLREKLLRDAGANSIEGYLTDPAHPGRHMPRTVLVVDEAHNALGHRPLQTLIGRICKEGRKFGFHVILITQSLQALPFEPSVKDSIRLRIGCKMGPAASRNLFEHDNSAAADLPNSPRARFAVINTDGGHPGANRIANLIYVPSNQIDARVQALTKRFGAAKLLEPSSAFEGGATQAITPEPVRGDAVGAAFDTLKKLQRLSTR
jgi:hypothetical protein